MGVSNVNIKNITQLALQKKATRTAETAKPQYLQMTGSIFNAPQANSKTQTKDNLNNLNTLRSLNDLNNQTKVKPKKEEKDSMPGNASEGRSQAKQMQNESNNVKAKAKEAEQYTKTVNNFAAESQKTDKQIKNSDKKFAAQLKTQQAEIKRDNQKLAKLIQEQEETQTQIDNAQHELDSLMASSSFSLGKGNGTNSSNPNQSRISELQEFIGAKVSGMQANGKAIYSLQRSTSKTFSRMNRTNAQFIKAQKVNKKSLQQNESSTSKIIKTAEKIEQISALVTQGGQALKLLGDAMIAASASGSIFTAWMAPVGTVMKKVGTVAEMVGNYGQSAANITKTAAYAADGNIVGAMQSCAAAAMTGVAAAQSTKGLKDEFGKIDAQAQKAEATAQAKQKAKAEIRETENAAIDDAKKTKYLEDNHIDADVDDISLSREELDGIELSKDEIKNAKRNAFGVDKNGKTISAGQARKNLVNKELAEKGFTNTVVSNSTKSSTSVGDRITKFTQGLQTTAALFGQNNTAGNTRNRGYAPQWNLSGDRRFMRIHNSNRRFARV